MIYPLSGMRKEAVAFQKILNSPQIISKFTNKTKLAVPTSPNSLLFWQGEGLANQYSAATKKYIHRLLAGERLINKKRILRHRNKIIALQQAAQTDPEAAKALIAAKQEVVPRFHLKPLISDTGVSVPLGAVSNPSTSGEIWKHGYTFSRDPSGKTSWGKVVWPESSVATPGYKLLSVGDKTLG